MGKTRFFKKHKYNILVSILIVLFCVISYSFFTFSTQIEITEQEKSIHQLKQMYEHSVLAINSTLGSAEEKIAALSETINGLPDKEKQQALEVMHEVIMAEGFSYVGIIDESGSLVASTGEELEISDEEFQNVEMTSDLDISDVVQTSMGEALIFSNPIEKDGRPAGHFYGVYMLEKLEKRFGENFNEENSYFQIIDPEGGYILSTGNRQILQREGNLWDEVKNYTFKDPYLSAKQLKRAVGTGEEGIIHFSFKDQERLSYFAPLEVNGWYLFSVMNCKSVESNIMKLRDDVLKLLGSIAAAFVIIVMITLFYSYIARREIVKVTEEIAVNEQMLSIAFEETKNVLFEYFPVQKRIHFFNPKVWGRNLQNVENNIPEDLIKRDIVLRDYEDILYDAFKKIAEGSKKEQCVVPMRRDTILCWCKIVLINVFGKDDKPVRTIGMIENIDEEKKRELQLIKEQQYRQAMQEEVERTFEINLARDTMTFSSGKVIGLSNNSYTYFLEKYLKELVYPEHTEDLLYRIAPQYLIDKYYKGERHFKLEFKKKNSQGEYRWMQYKIVLLRSVTSEDIMAEVEQRDIHAKKSKELEWKRKAERDFLTGLYNRRALEDNIREYLAEKTELQGIQAFMLIDLDNFKSINDTFGHDYGDIVLKDVAEKLEKSYRDTDFTARLGGDEFVVFLKNCPTIDVVMMRAEQLEQMIKMVYEKDGIGIAISASIGVCTIDNENMDFNEIYKRADVALYHVKKAGKAGFKIYNTDMDSEYEKEH